MILFPKSGSASNSFPVNEHTALFIVLADC